MNQNGANVKTLLKWLGIGATVLICLLLLCAAWVYGASSRQINRRYSPGVSWIAIPRDSASVARGRHLVLAMTKCVDCHGADLSGTAFFDDPAFARVHAPNITTGRGGKGSVYTDQELMRVIQHGVKRDGRAVMIMPADAYTHLSDGDLASIAAYVRSVPPVDKEWPAPRYGPVGRALMAFGKLPVFAAAYIDHERRDVLPRPEPDTTVAYGRYLTLIGGCQVCHNPAMSGGERAGSEPGSPLASNLTPTGIGHYTEADFFRVLREGKGPGDRVITDFMPWKSSGRMTDAEIHAIWLFLQTLAPKEMGER
jgi:mono/diheme cytochrome c family protein